MIFLPSFVPRQCFHATPWLQLCSAQGWGLLPAICYLPLGSEQQCLEQAHHPEAAGRQATLTDRKTALKGIFPEKYGQQQSQRGVFSFSISSLNLEALEKWFWTKDLTYAQWCEGGDLLLQTIKKPPLPVFVLSICIPPKPSSEKEIHLNTFLSPAHLVTVPSPHLPSAMAHLRGSCCWIYQTLLL